jgi:hypothetical protein
MRYDRRPLAQLQDLAQPCPIPSSNAEQRGSTMAEQTTWTISTNDDDDLTIWIQGPELDSLTYRQLLDLHEAIGRYLIGR